MLGSLSLSPLLTHLISTPTDNTLCHTYTLRYSLNMHYPVDGINTLMLAAILHTLPTAEHHAWVCSAGSKGYCATKEMLQNGIPGHTYLIESGDLRDVDASSEDGYLLIYCFTEEVVFNYGHHIPISVSHLTVYGNVSAVPKRFLQECTGLTSLDLGPLSQLREVQLAFLEGCTGLTSLELAPFSRGHS